MGSSELHIHGKSPLNLRFLNVDLILAANGSPSVFQMDLVSILVGSIRFADPTELIILFEQASITDIFAEKSSIASSTKSYGLKSNVGGLPTAT